MSWNALMSESTVRIPKKLVAAYREWAAEQDHYYVEVDDDGGISINSDAMEHYESVIVEELMPFVREHPEIGGRLVFLDEKEGLVGYEISGGRLYQLKPIVTWEGGEEVE